MNGQIATLAIGFVGGLVALGIILAGILDARRGSRLDRVLLCGLVAFACAVVVVVAVVPISQPYKALAWWAAGSSMLLIGIIAGRWARRQREKTVQSIQRSFTVDGSKK